MPDAWENGFDEWDGSGAPPESLGREQLLRLARELAQSRASDRAEAFAEVEELKLQLRQRVELVAAKERELDRRERALAELEQADTAAPRPAQRARFTRRREPQEQGPPSELDVQRRQLAERAAAVAARERELAERERERELAEQAEPAHVRRGLRRRVPVADAQDDQTAIEAARAEAARTRELEQRAAALDTMERQLEEQRARLAAAHLELEEGRATLDERERALGARDGALNERAAELVTREQELAQALAQPPPAPAVASVEPQHDDEERALAARAAKLEARERELALIRQGLDAERNALLARERELRTRAAEDARRTFAPPLEPLRFSEGFAAFASARHRR